MNALTKASKPLAAASASAPSYTPEQIATVQGLLNRLGYGPVAVNGTLDSSTQAALTEFFKAQNIPWTVDTPVNFDTLANGMREYAERQGVEQKPAATPSASPFAKVPKWVWFAGGALAVAWYVNDRMGEKGAEKAEPATVSGLDSPHVKPVKPARRKGHRLPDITADELKAGAELVEAAAA